MVTSHRGVSLVVQSVLSMVSLPVSSQASPSQTYTQCRIVQVTGTLVCFSQGWY